MDSSAIATQRVRLSLALAVGGAVLLMAGVSMTLTGEVMKLAQPSGWQHLVTPGVVLAVLGFALGVAFAVVAMSGSLDSARPGRLPQRRGDLAGHGAADSAEEWLSPLRGNGIRPGGALGRAAGAGSAAGYRDAGQFGGEYADQGWQLDGPELTPQPPPAASPAQEIHHPIRPLTASRAPAADRIARAGQYR